MFEKWFISGIIKAIREKKHTIRSRIALWVAQRKVNKMMDGKSWYKSKGVWTAIVGVILGAVQPISTSLGHPVQVPEWVYAILGSFGLYAIRDGQGKPLTK